VFGEKKFNLVITPIHPLVATSRSFQLFSPTLHQKDEVTKDGLKRFVRSLKNSLKTFSHIDKLMSIPPDSVAFLYSRKKVN
jgi:hypothetical protein